MSKKNSPLTLVEENEEKQKFAGMLKADLEAAASAIRTQKSKSAVLSGDLSAKLENFENKKGNKKAVKLATWLADSEPAVAADFLRCLEGYCQGLGVFDQIDMFDQERDNQLKLESVAIASKPAEGAEPATAH